MVWKWRVTSIYGQIIPFSRRFHDVLDSSHLCYNSLWLCSSCSKACNKFLTCLTKPACTNLFTQQLAVAFLQHAFYTSVNKSVKTTFFRQCEDNLLTGCSSRLATSLLQTHYTLRVFARLPTACKRKTWTSETKHASFYLPQLSSKYALRDQLHE